VLRSHSVTSRKIGFRFRASLVRGSGAVKAGARPLDWLGAPAIVLASTAIREGERLIGSVEMCGTRPRLARDTRPRPGARLGTSAAVRLSTGSRRGLIGEGVRDADALADRPPPAGAPGLSV